MNQYNQMKKVANILIAVTFISTQLFAQQTPGNVQKEAITLLGGIAHIGNGTIIKIALSYSKMELLKPVLMLTNLE